MRGITVSVGVCVAVACAGVHGAGDAWRPSLSYDGGGYWRLRVRVEVDNPLDEPLQGAPALLHVKADDPNGG